MTDKMREAFEEWNNRPESVTFFDCWQAAWQAAKSVPVVGEPVAWINEAKLSCVRKGYLLNVYLRGDAGSGIANLVPLYSAPPTASITEAELERLRKDAERYRWLRDDAFEHSEDCFFEAGQLFAGHQGDSFDVAVDAAIAGEKK